MDNLVKIYENVLEDDWCDRIIKKYEDNPDQYEEHKHGPMSFTQIKIQQFPEWGDEFKKLVEVFVSQKKRYAKDVLVNPLQWPKNHGWEEFRVKRYLPNGVDRFDWHVDCSNHEDAKRFLVMFLYLDNNESGETDLLMKEGGTASVTDRVVSPCKKGSVLMFPPMWPWLHAGKIPTHTPKYIVGSYLHYD